MAYVISTEAEYRHALDRLARFLDDGAKSEDDREMAELEAAIARYVNDPHEPARRTGRPRTNRP